MVRSYSKVSRSAAAAASFRSAAIAEMDSRIAATSRAALRRRTCAWVGLGR